MNFGEMVETLKDNLVADRCYIARRAGWNGKRMAIAFMPGRTLQPEQLTPHTKNCIELATGAPVTYPVEIGAYFSMWTAQGTWQPGWLASQADMLAEDWEVDSVVIDITPSF